MNIKAALLAAVVVVLAFQCSDAFFLRDICKPACPRVCPKKVFGIQVNCDVVCKTICGRKKRMVVDDDYHVTPLPRSFKFYDINEDTFVDISELAKTLGQNQPSEGLNRAFNYTDTDANGLLTKRELLMSEVLVFEEPEEL